MRNQTAPVVTGILALASALLIACGGSSADATATPDASSSVAYATALAALTTDDLGALVLQQRDYSLLALGMDISTESGPTDNAKAAHDFETLIVSESQLDRLGRLGGYKLAFESPRYDEGIVGQLASWIDLFDDGGDPDGYIDLSIEDIRTTDGVGGVAIEELIEIDVPGIEGARAWRGVIRYPGVASPYGWTFGVIQRGRLIAGVQVAELGTTDRSPELIALLEQYDKRLQGALDGTIEVSVEHVLPATDEDRKVPAPLGGPDFAAMALTADDLGPGWRIDDDGYYADPSRLAVFTRTFKYTEQGTADIGGVVVTSAESQLELWDSPEAAASFIADRRLLFEGEAGALRFAGLVAEDDGPEIENTTTELFDLALGDQALVLVISGEWPVVGQQGVVLIWVRSGASISTITIEVGVEAPSIEALEALATTAAAHLEATAS